MTNATESLTAEVAALMQETFARQGAMTALQARLTNMAPGSCEITVPMSAAATQQHGYFHGGVIGTVADVAGGFAGMTVLLPTHECLSAEFKINFVAPAIGQALIGRGKVVKAGKTLVVASAEIFTVNDGVEKLCAIMQQTLFALPKK
jgi:uncharacterized protein (TIGR00369 family)